MHNEPLTILASVNVTGSNSPPLTAAETLIISGGTTELSVHQIEYYQMYVVPR